MAQNLTILSEIQSFSLINTSWIIVNLSSIFRVLTKFIVTTFASILIDFTEKKTFIGIYSGTSADFSSRYILFFSLP